MTTRTLVTADELLRMPDDGRRYELIEGGIDRNGARRIEAR